MSLLDIDSYKDIIDNQIKNKLEEILSSIKNNIVYDAQVEGIDLSKMNISLEKVDDENYSVVISIDELNDYYKHLVKDIYLPNGLQRRKW